MAEECLQNSAIEISSSGDKLAEVRRYIGDVAKSCGFSEREIFDIKVAVGEACANAIEHGSPRGSDGRVCISCECNPGDLIIRVTDEGQFKRQVPGLNNRTDYRGRGILIMLALMDKVSIDESEQGTTVRLSKHQR